MSRSMGWIWLVVAAVCWCPSPPAALAEDSAESPPKQPPPPAERPPASPEKPIPADRPRAVPADLGRGLKCTGPARWEITRDEFMRLMFNAPTISKLLWVRQVKKKGRLVGYKLKHITKGNLVHRAGFRNGDVVTRINGQRLLKPESLLLTIGASDRIDVQLYRAGKLRKHVYLIVP